MKVYDCTLYHDEDLILELRFNILSKFVDKFVICESKFSHSGREKKLNFDIKKFPEFKKKIIYLVSTDEPSELIFDKNSIEKKELPENFRHNAVKRIAHQRNKLFDGLGEANEDDFILYSDNDEIPNLDHFNFKNFNKKYVMFEQKLCYYKLNLFFR
jgi:beta-1,4-mannosyl-glycoprotein beta-1,4-N-acetylglucosaminyltransferase